MRIAHRTVKAARFTGFIFLVAVSFAAGQESATLRQRFTNQDVIEMAKLGLSDDVIIAKIRQAYQAGTDAVSFDTSVDGLKSLKAANVPDSVIKVMINPAPPPASIVAGTGPMSVDPSLPPPEVGVYWRDQGQFVRLQGQAVTNTKTGGKAGSFFSNGLRNQHWDATIAGNTSRNVVRDRQPMFYLYVPDGDDSSDYVLIKLNKKSDHREFQIGSFGGITGQHFSMCSPQSSRPSADFSARSKRSFRPCRRSWCCHHTTYPGDEQTGPGPASTRPPRAEGDSDQPTWDPYPRQ